MLYYPALNACINGCVYVNLTHVYIYYYTPSEIDQADGKTDEDRAGGKRLKLDSVRERGNRKGMVRLKERESGRWRGSA